MSLYRSITSSTITAVHPALVKRLPCSPSEPSTARIGTRLSAAYSRQEFLTLVEWDTNLFYGWFLVDIIVVSAGSCNELSVAITSYQSQISSQECQFTFCTIILSGDKTISHQSEQQHPQQRHPQLRHPQLRYPPPQGEEDMQMIN